MVKRLANIMLVMIIALQLTITASAEEIKGDTEISNIIAAGSYHTAWINKDGSVDAIGGYQGEYLYGDAWEDVSKISAYHQTVGIKEDGTVVLDGEGFYGKYYVKDWNNIIDVDINECNIIGLCSDGTAVITGANKHRYDVSGWNDLVDVAQGTYAAYGLQSNGTVVAQGEGYWGQLNVNEWKDITAISAGVFHVTGLKSDGTVVIAGESYWADMNVSDWKDIVAISAGANHVVGLRSDGTVVATGYNNCGQCDVGAWKNIIAIDAGFEHTIGLTAEGTLVAVGSDKNSQCNFEIDQRK